MVKLGLFMDYGHPQQLKHLEISAQNLNFAHKTNLILNYCPKKHKMNWIRRG